MGNTFGRSPKFVRYGDFLWQWVTIDLLIELCPMVLFVAKVPHGVSQPAFA